MNRAKERRYRARAFADAIPISKDAVGVLIGSVQLMPFTWMTIMVMITGEAEKCGYISGWYLEMEVNRLISLLFGRWRNRIGE